MNFKRLPKLSFKTILFILIVFSLGVGFGQKFLTNPQSKPQDEIEKNTPKAFVLEIYDKIKENYWNNISDAELLDLFKLSMEKTGVNVTVAKFENKDKLLEAINKATAGMKEEQRSQFLATAVSSVLSSLAPAGRSGLYTQKQEEQLKNTVSNINLEKDLYKDLGLQKGASETAVL